jgi:hypothetical protein
MKSFKQHQNESRNDGMTDGRPDMHKSRQMNTGDAPSDEETIKFHQGEIDRLGPNAYKSHIQANQRQINKAQRNIDRHKKRMIRLFGTE